MYFLTLLIVSLVSSTLAIHSSSHLHSFTTHLHDVALKHSAYLAKDLRVALGGVLLTQRREPSNAGLQKRAVYCVSQQSNGNGAQVPVGGGGGNGTTSATRPSSTSGPVPSATSSWNLAEVHVSLLGFVICTRNLLRI